MMLSRWPWWWAPVLALGCTFTVPAQSLLAPALAKLIAAARVMPGVCGVLRSSSEALTMRTPWSRQSGASARVMAHFPPPGIARARVRPRARLCQQRQGDQRAAEGQARRPHGLARRDQTALAVQEMIGQRDHAAVGKGMRRRPADLLGRLHL